MKKFITFNIKGLSLFLFIMMLFVSCEEDETLGTDPIADFSYSVVEEDDPFTVAFTATLEHAKGISWDFGDGSDPVIDENPIHTYSKGGDFQVTLVAIGEGGSNVIAVKTLTIVPPPPAPSASFNYILDETNPLTAVFMNTSTDASTHEWDFGDEAGTSTETNPSYTYDKAGTYQVTLTATGEGGVNSVTRDVTVGEEGGGDPVNVLKGSEMNPEDADQWLVKNYRSANQFTIEFNGKLQLTMTPNQPPNALIYQVVNLEPGKYRMNAHLAVTGIVNGWMEFNAIPGSEIPSSDPGATYKLMGWTFWCGRESGAPTADLEGYIADVYCEGDSDILEVTEAGPYIIAVKVGFSNNSSSAQATPILIDDFTLTPVVE